MDDAARHFQAFLDALGWTDDPALADTAVRVAAMFREGFTPGEPPPLSTFPVAGAGPVVLRDLPFHSLCAHHLLPFFGTATIGYQPAGRVAGFSGVARLLHFHARRPQLQERLAADLADDLMARLGAAGVVVKLSARQLCMEMRGTRTAGTIEVVAARGEAGALRLV